MTIQQRVQGLIAESGLSQAQFSAQIELEPTKLSKSLNGHRNFTSLELARIAEHARVTVDWLLTGNTDEFATAARAGVAGAIPNAALSLARDLTSMREGLVDLGFTRQTSLHQVRPYTGSKRVDQGKDLAKRAQKVMPHAHEADDLPTLIEHCFGVDVVVDDLGELDGMAVATPSAKIILAATTPTPGRQRFTLMHELAHLLASDDQQLHTDVNVYAKAGEGEVRANVFAAEMLMPAQVLREATAEAPSLDDLCELAWGLRVTPAALAWRLFNEVLIDDARRDALLAVTAAEAAERIGKGDEYAVRVASSSQRRAPTPLLVDALSAYRAGHTTLRPVARLLATTTEALRAQLAKTE